jgi:hypothetical protein
MEIDRKNHFRAGFFITKKIDRPEYCSDELLPDKIISLSNCICKFIPDTWCIEWTGDKNDLRDYSANYFSIDTNLQKKFAKWITGQFDKNFGWPNVIFQIEMAKEIISSFVEAIDEILIIEAGLHRQFLKSFIAAAESTPSAEGYAPIGRQGLLEVILNRNRLSDNGVTLGYEPLVFNYSLSCSWLCNGLEKVAHEHLEIVPNTEGLINCFNDARRCVEFISRDEIGSEPGLWLPWLLIKHEVKR